MIHDSPINVLKTFPAQLCKIQQKYHQNRITLISNPCQDDKIQLGH